MLRGCCSGLRDEPEQRLKSSDRYEPALIFECKRFHHSAPAVSTAFVKVLYYHHLEQKLSVTFARTGLAFSTRNTSNLWLITVFMVVVTYVNGLLKCYSTYQHEFCTTFSHSVTNFPCFQVLRSPCRSLLSHSKITECRDNTFQSFLSFKSLLKRTERYWCMYHVGNDAVRVSRDFGWNSSSLGNTLWQR